MYLYTVAAVSTANGISHVSGQVFKSWASASDSPVQYFWLLFGRSRPGPAEIFATLVNVHF